MNLITYPVTCKKGLQEKEYINIGFPVVFNAELGLIPNREKLWPLPVAPGSVSVTPPGLKLLHCLVLSSLGSVLCKITLTPLSPAPSSGGT